MTFTATGRHPTEFRAFRAEAWPDSLVNKGALKITVELGPSFRLNIWNVHLQAGSAGWRGTPRSTIC
jgi:hypothetical protein